MTTDARDELSFLQAEGLAPLPTQLELKVLSREVRALLWASLFTSMKTGITREPNWEYQFILGPDWSEILLRWHVMHEHRAADEFVPLFDPQMFMVKDIILNHNYANVLELVTFVIRDRSCPQRLDRALADALELGRAAYRIRGKTVFPMASVEEGRVVDAAYAAVSEGPFQPARSHLEAAAAALNTGDFAGSVRESIHAVESVAKIVEPRASTLADALKRLDGAGRINPNLKRGLNALYDYSSDEEGIRHARVFEKEANVDEADAIFMFGACAAFLSYLVARSRSVTP